MHSNPRFHRSLIAAIVLTITTFLGANPLLGATYTLESAVRAGWLTVSGFASSGFSEATLNILNRTGMPIDIDFSTVCFVQNNDTQRVGLAYEKSTGSYFLQFAAGKQYSLRFSSRCLDLNRHSPVTGTAFTRFFQIDSTAFAPIVNALRCNYSQSSVWSITDANSSLSRAWKNADPRTPPGGSNNPPVVNGGLHLSGNCSWSTSYGQVRIAVARVENRDAYGRSGTLRLRLLASKTPFSSGLISGYTLGSMLLGPLNAGSSFGNIANYVAYVRPPSGYYYTTLLLEEYSGGNYYVKDFITFPNQTLF